MTKTTTKRMNLIKQLKLIQSCSNLF